MTEDKLLIPLSHIKARIAAMIEFDNKRLNDVQGVPAASRHTYIYGRQTGNLEGRIDALEDLRDILTNDHEVNQFLLFTSK